LKTVHPAISTPRPLPRKREPEDKRPWLSLTGAVPAHASNDDVKNIRLSPAKAIQKDEAPLSRRKRIQTNEGLSDFRLATLARITALRLEIRQLVEAITLSADIELIDLMRSEVGSYSRHKTAHEARTRAKQARLSIETGSMQLDHALQSTSTLE